MILVVPDLVDIYASFLVGLFGMSLSRSILGLYYYPILLLLLRLANLFLLAGNSMSALGGEGMLMGSRAWLRPFLSILLALPLNF